jgi:hypothetical protein
MIPYTYDFDYYVGDTYPIVIYDGSVEEVPLFVTLPVSSLNSYISTDSITWTVVNLPMSSSFTDIVYGNGRFVGVSYGPTTQHVVYSSVNENNVFYWTRGTLPVTSNWSSVAYGNNIFVTVGRSSFSPSPAAISTNGITWTRSTMPGASGQQWKITYGNERFVAIINSSVTAVSTNGITWTTGSIPNLDWFDVSHGNNTFVAIADGNRSAYSTNGIVWTQVTLPINRSWRTLKHANNIFIGAAIGASTSETVTSTNGITWATRTLPVAQVWWEATYGTNTFVFFGAFSAAKSTDGITWTSMAKPGTVGDNLRAITFGNAGYPKNIKYSLNKTGLFTVSTQRGNPEAEIFSIPVNTSYPEYRLTAEITPQLGSLLTGASYVYDIEVRDDNEVFTLLTGTITTQQDVKSN